MALVLSALTGFGTSAQDASPVPMAVTAHPAHIHEGTCDTLGSVVYPLTDVGLAPAADGATSEPMMMHASEVLTSVTVVDVSLDDLLAGEFAINVHESAENIQNYVACGEIVGVIRMHQHSDAPPGLVIPLRELNESDFAGVAWLEPTSDTQTTVTIFLAEGLVGRGPMR
jgi:hypothetical protein